MPFVGLSIRRSFQCGRSTTSATATATDGDIESIDGFETTKVAATIVHTDGIDQFDDACQTNEIVPAAAATTGSTGSGRRIDIVEIGFQRLDGPGKGFRVHSGIGIRRGDGDFLSARNMERQTAIVGYHDDIATRIGNEGFAVIERIARLDGAQFAIRPACESTAFD